MLNLSPHHYVPIRCNDLARGQLKIFSVTFGTGGRALPIPAAATAAGVVVMVVAAAAAADVVVRIRRIFQRRSGGTTRAGGISRPKDTRRRLPIVRRAKMK